MLQKEFSKQDRLLGKYCAFTLFWLGVVYIVVTALGLLSLQSPLDPIGDPYFTIMELLILIMAPLMVVLMVMVYAYASDNSKIYGLMALVFMSITACITCSVHYLVLTVSHAAQSATDLAWFFSFKWPSVIYALDILAWDFFFSLSVLFAAAIFKGDRRKTWARTVLIVSGILSIIGLLGPVFGDMQIRNIGIVGYGVFFPIACLLLARVFSKAE